ncbi:ornithine cyclodeaminase family protein [Candidatus Neomarinimicrobiota bacterium]
MEPKIIHLNEIIEIVESLDLISAIEKGFDDYSSGRAIVPPIGELLLENGDVHIKYGYIQEDDFYVVKIASGFYKNQPLGLSTNYGLMLIFSQQTGVLVSILLDEGYLTNVRTALAGAIAAKHLAPKQIDRIGILGTGTQAQLQVEYLKNVIACREVLVWGRGEKQLAQYCSKMKNSGFQIETTLDTTNILRSCNLIVTTTPAVKPLLRHSDLQKGVHITAVGSDTPDKQELDSEILQQADLVVADSISQCLLRGEIHHSIKRGHLIESEIIELGNIIAGRVSGRNSDDQITVADLTGVAVQDIKIAAAVYINLTGN